MGNVERREKELSFAGGVGVEFGYDDDDLLNDVVDFDMEDRDMSELDDREPPPPEIVELIASLRTGFGQALPQLRQTMEGYGIPDSWQDEVEKTMESVGKELENSFEAVLQNRRFRMLVMGPSNAGKTTLIRYVTGASYEYQKRSTTETTTQWYHVEGTNWTVLDTVGLEVGDKASLRDLRRKIVKKLPDVILVALSLRDQRRWTDPNFEATKLLKAQLAMVQDVFMKQTGNKCRAPIVWVATQLDEARDDEFNCKRGIPWETWKKDVTSEFDTVLQVIAPHFNGFSDCGYDPLHLCITAVNVDEGKTFGVDEPGGLLDRISSQSGIVAMVHNNDFHRYYVSSRRALAMKIIASFSGIAGVIGLIPLVDIPLTFIVGDIMLSVLECLKVDPNKSVEEYKQRYSTGLALGNAATVAMFIAGMVLDFTVLGIVAGEAVGATTAVSSITALGVHAYDYFTEEDTEGSNPEGEGAGEGKTLEEIEKGVFDYVLTSSKERKERGEVGRLMIGSEGKSEGNEEGFGGKILSFLSWKKQPKVEVKVYRGEEELEAEIQEVNGEEVKEDGEAEKEKGKEKEKEKPGFMSSLFTWKGEEKKEEGEEGKKEEGEGLLTFIKRKMEGEDEGEGEEKEKESVEVEVKEEKKSDEEGFFSFLKKKKEHEKKGEEGTGEGEGEGKGEGEGDAEEKKSDEGGFFTYIKKKIEGEGEKKNEEEREQEGEVKVEEKATESGEVKGEGKSDEEGGFFSFLRKKEEKPVEKVSAEEKKVTVEEKKPSLFSSISFFSRNSSKNANNTNDSKPNNEQTHKEKTKGDDEVDFSDATDSDSSISEVREKEHVKEAKEEVKAEVRVNEENSVEASEVVTEAIASHETKEEKEEKEETKDEEPKGEANETEETEETKAVEEVKVEGKEDEEDDSISSDSDEVTNETKVAVDDDLELSSDTD